MKNILLAALAIVTFIFVALWARFVRSKTPIETKPASARQVAFGIFIGFVTDFLDTLGIGSFATTSSLFKLKNVVADENIPGTMNVAHCLPTIAEAFIFISIVQVDMLTMVSMIIASMLGAWLGAKAISNSPRRTIQIALGMALLAAAFMMFMSQMAILPAGGEKLGLTGSRLYIAVIGNFILGALMSLGIGLYAPCMVLVSLLGMNPRAAFPIMMGSCAFLMPIGGLQFVRSGRYDLRMSILISLGGIPGVLLAAYLVKSLPLDLLRCLVICVVLYASIMLLRSAIIESQKNKC
jgi:uncharacterized membrane protein YfcA